MTLRAPSLEHVCDLEVEAGPVAVLGATGIGTRRVVPIAGGTMTGPLLSGRVIGVGADWQTVAGDGVAEIDARYLLATHDGAEIELVDRGVRRAAPDVLARLASGEVVPHDEYYMRSAVRLTTGDARYAWVNATVFVATGMRSATGVAISIYAVR